MRAAPLRRWGPLAPAGATGAARRFGRALPRRLVSLVPWRNRSRVTGRIGPDDQLWPQRLPFATAVGALATGCARCL